MLLYRSTRLLLYGLSVAAAFMVMFKFSQSSPKSWLSSSPPLSTRIFFSWQKMFIHILNILETITSFLLLLITVDALERVAEPIKCKNHVLLVHSAHSFTPITPLGPIDNPTIDFCGAFLYFWYISHISDILYTYPLQFRIRLHH